VIEGFRIDVTADELAELLNARIERHQEIAADCEQRRIRLEAVTTPEPDDDDAQLAAAWPHYLEHLERRAERHRDRAETLVFLRERVVCHEIYRLGERDLRFLQLWPGRDKTISTPARSLK
jgi:hypothetical protein